MNDWPLTGIAAPLPLMDVNTDLIYPQAYLRRTDIEGMGAFLFHDIRFDASGEPEPGFVLNRDPWREARILVAGRNFGSGSSREHAVWALKGFGIRAVVSPLLADIFRSNCLNNGVAPVEVAEADLPRCLRAASDPATCRFTVDIAAGVLRNEALGAVPFSLSAGERSRLLEDRDAIDDTLMRQERISIHEARIRADAPWLRLQPWSEAS